MAIEEHTDVLNHALRQLERVGRRQWTTPGDKTVLVRTLKSQVSAAEPVLQRPPTPETASARGKLIGMAELTRHTVKRYEKNGRLVCPMPACDCREIGDAQPLEPVPGQ
jgi:hypothetical protein